MRALLLILLSLTTGCSSSEDLASPSAEPALMEEAGGEAAPPGAAETPERALEEAPEAPAREVEEAAELEDADLPSAEAERIRPEIQGQDEAAAAPRATALLKEDPEERPKLRALGAERASARKSSGPARSKAATDDGLPVEAALKEGAIAPAHSLPEASKSAGGSIAAAEQPEQAEAPAEPSPSFDVDSFVEELPEEAIVFNVPAEVLIDSVTQVRLLIQPGQDEAALQARFEAGRGALQTGELSTEAVKTSDEMGASLVSSGLDVTAMRPERQLLSRREPTEWLWEIRAREGGRQVLTLTLYAIPPGRSSGRTLRVMEREMQVFVPPSTQAVAMIQDNWEWMWTFLLAPLGGWWLTRKRRREDAPPPAV